VTGLSGRTKHRGRAAANRITGDAKFPGDRAAANRITGDSPREHGARATRGRGLVDRTTFPYENLRDGATLPTGPGTLLAHGRAYEQPTNRRQRESERAALEQVARLVRMKLWSGTHVSRAGNPCSRARINRHFPALGREF